MKLTLSPTGKLSFNMNGYGYAFENHGEKDCIIDTSGGFPAIVTPGDHMKSYGCAPNVEGVKDGECSGGTDLECFATAAEALGKQDRVIKGLKDEINFLRNSNMNQAQKLDVLKGYQTEYGAIIKEQSELIYKLRQKIANAWAADSWKECCNILNGIYDKERLRIGWKDGDIAVAVKDFTFDKVKIITAGIQYTVCKAGHGWTDGSLTILGDDNKGHCLSASYFK